MELGLAHPLEHLAIHLQLLCLLVSRLVPHAHIWGNDCVSCDQETALPDGEVRDLWRLSEKSYAPAGDTEVQRSKKLDLLETKPACKTGLCFNHCCVPGT